MKRILKNAIARTESAWMQKTETALNIAESRAESPAPCKS